MQQNGNGKNYIVTQESCTPFPARLKAADERTRMRYNAVKNAFMGYKSPSGDITAATSARGESFYAGAKLLGEIRIVRGYVRLFVALKPAKYAADKFQHNDYTNTVSYTNVPLGINVCNSQRINAAYAVINEVMRLNRCMPRADHVAEDWTEFIDDRAEPFDPEEMARADGEVADGDIIEDMLPEPESAKGAAEGSARPSGGKAAKAGSAVKEESGSAAAIVAAEYDIPSPVRLPRRAKVVDAEGNKIGSVRASKWYDLEGKLVGIFRREEKSVRLHHADLAGAYLDKNDNVMALSGNYVATLKRFPLAILIIILAILIFATVLSGVLGASFLSRSESIDYAPTLFVADEKGISWDEMESLDVFVNQQFGDNTIAPGVYGNYAFTLENRNADDIEFSLTFSCENEYGIDLAYSLERDGQYVAGGASEESKLSPEGLNAALDAAQTGEEYHMTLAAGSETVFVLGWLWRHNDPVDTVAGESGMIYKLHITFTASVVLD